MVYNFFEKKSKGSCVANNEIKQNRLPLDLATNQLLKIKKKRTVYSRFKDNIWGADLADMQLISKLNKRFRF